MSLVCLYGSRARATLRAMPQVTCLAGTGAQGPQLQEWLAASGMRVGDQVQFNTDAGGRLLIRRVAQMDAAAQAAPSMAAGDQQEAPQPALAQQQQQQWEEGAETPPPAAAAEPVHGPPVQQRALSTAPLTQAGTPAGTEPASTGAAGGVGMGRGPAPGEAPNQAAGSGPAAAGQAAAGSGLEQQKKRRGVATLWACCGGGWWGREVAPYMLMQSKLGVPGELSHSTWRALLLLVGCCGCQRCPRIHSVAAWGITGKCAWAGGCHRHCLPGADLLLPPAYVADSVLQDLLGYVPNAATSYLAVRDAATGQAMQFEHRLGSTELTHILAVCADSHSVWAMQCVCIVSCQPGMWHAACTLTPAMRTGSLDLTLKPS